jgi:hypothetical protein
MTKDSPPGTLRSSFSMSNKKITQFKLLLYNGKIVGYYFVWSPYNTTIMGGSYTGNVSLTSSVKIEGNVIGIYARLCSTNTDFYYDTLGFITDLCQSNICQYYDITKFDLSTVPVMSAKVSQVANFAFKPKIS